MNELKPVQAPMAADLMRMIESQAVAAARWVVPACLLAGLVIGAVGN
ncbi:hypothetical protein GLS40_01790 [Pseudooceanicola sp. 216_PA32_1]|jgi:hypothetical protein|uniref:Uncharacterized protein n=1 Tax=Pseudooceanicola pacificus TaxID=2676438 RepID=A0A844WBQ0_9RHOB|nr:hypothetical protein [Pseudooceanicola pacificus]MWB76750.1 hypothetical protein [Pseudooceanicola pacificus]